MAEIRLNGVTKNWGAEPAVDGVSFAADPGSLLVLLGPSGCGKSTTLRLIAGLDAPDAGTIEIAGRDVTRDPPSRRGVAMVFQSYALFPHLSVAENIVFGLKVRRSRARSAPPGWACGGAPRAATSARPQTLAALRRPAAARRARPRSRRADAGLSDGRAAVQPDAQLRGEMRREIRACSAVSASPWSMSRTIR